MNDARRIRLFVALALMGALSACTRTGLNAGEQGGRAFVGLTVMLLITIAILAIALGREK